MHACIPNDGDHARERIAGWTHLLKYDQRLHCTTGSFLSFHLSLHLSIACIPCHRHLSYHAGQRIAAEMHLAKYDQHLHCTVAFLTRVTMHVKSTHRRPLGRISLSRHLVKPTKTFTGLPGHFSLVTSHFCIAFIPCHRHLSSFKEVGSCLSYSFGKAFEMNPGEWTFRALLLDASFALRYERLFNEGSTTCSTAHALLESDLLELENDDDLAKVVTPEPAEHARAGASSSSELLSDKNANGERPAKIPKCRASILNRLLNDSTVAAEHTSQQTSEALVERDRYMEHIRLHNLGSYYNQDHGYFNTHGFWKDNLSLFPRLGVMPARWLSTSATSASSERVFSQSSLLLRKHATRQLPQRVEMMVFLRAKKHRWPELPRVQERYFEAYGDKVEDHIGDMDEMSSDSD